MTQRLEEVFAWSGLCFVVCFGIGWAFVAGFIPPPPPDLEAARVASFYRDNANAIRLGLVLCLTSVLFFAPWSALVSLQMRRIEGCRPLLAYTQLLCAGVSILMLIIPTLLWTTAAFRPERSPELTQLIHDLGWLMITMTFPTPMLQNLAFGAAILKDDAPKPLFPRWAGYFNIWVGLLFLPGCLVTFFKSGPFAWSGLLAFWLPAAVFFTWFIVMTPLMLAAVRRP